MARVSVTVNGQAYQVMCDDGQEARLEALAEYLDKRVRELADDLGQVGEARLLLMAGLLNLDELREAHDRIKTLSAEIDEASAAQEKVTGKVAKAAESILSRTAGRLEDIAARLESS